MEQPLHVRKAKDLNRKVNLLKEILRNTVTKIKQDSKFKHYKEYFELHKDKSASIWKGIRSLIKLKSLSKKDISIVADRGSYFRSSHQVK